MNNEAINNSTDKTPKKDGATLNKEYSTLTLPNRTTFMEAREDGGTAFLVTPFSPVQLRVIIYIIKELQLYIKPQLPYIRSFSQEQINQHMVNLNVFQQSLFAHIENSFYCPLPKKIFVKGRNYKFFRQEVESLSLLKIRFKRRNPLTKKIAIYTTGLFSVYEDLSATNKKNKTNFITIEITKIVLEHLCFISVANKGEIEWDSDYYNQLVYEIILRCNRRYSGLLYFYLCTWRRQGGWRVSKEKLRTMLGLTTEYIRDAAFMKYVINPSIEELKNIGLDFWFEAAIENDFINFKIITPKSISEASDRRNDLIAFLKSCHLSEKHIKDLYSVISDARNERKIREITTGCIEYYFKVKGTEHEIHDIDSYIFASIRKWVINRKKQAVRIKLT
ncbi:MAG TPA: replication initiation protein [Arachidicoccus soli]|uniref:RepB family plasmid replication initiator protein n=1 Tax=Arachidicoccus soli TaxID=2341117 RepID=A0A386HU93_9BACT|nr:replication initiation protein [Arachidicoccus soli]AYD49081.1 RepB family plasmid replication initiator protein [Arachidicoccus soli]HEU0228188.1 replication initiation protein [Arachidicoccus soli]